MSLRAAVIGAGPSGFYATDQLLNGGFEVDLYDALPTPFGLVRAGVAPDHPKIKSVTRVYERTAAKDGFRFFGGVDVGTIVSRDELLKRYHAVVYAVGTPTDNRLGIPGEARPGSIAATEFVSWYNGHPNFAGHDFELSVRRAVVIGNGNVAIDVARMLVLDSAELKPTDTADHALHRFGAASVREVVIVGRRGPAQAAFTNPELRELGEVKRADVIVDPVDLVDVEITDEMSPVAQRNVEILREYAQRRPSGKSHRIVLRFLASPVEILGENCDGAVSGVRVVQNQLQDGRAVPTCQEDVISCGLVIRSIGYRGRPLEGVAFDEDKGLIRNDGGRVIGDHGQPQPGEYVVGWIKRGPSGVIGTNKKDAADTTARVMEDAEAGTLNAPHHDVTGQGIEQWLRARVPDLVTWDGWQVIDAHETAAGELAGRPRVKIVSVAEMKNLAVAQGR
jgi:ferredoxin--NADP+ reductase